MTKKQVIWREILFQAIEKKQYRFTQKELAQKMKVSLSTVFNALKIPRAAGIIEVKGRYFQLRDIEKFLYLWATHRNLSKEIIYQTHVDKPVNQIESEMPPNIIFGAYSAFKNYFKEMPADYDKIYIYTTLADLPAIQKRFPFQKGYRNLIVLKADAYLKKYGSVIPLCQLFCDLWNLPEWYAKDFIEELKKKIL